MGERPARGLWHTPAVTGRLPRLVLGALVLALALVPDGRAARAVAAAKVVRGATVFAVGTGFAPPNEFCRAVKLRVDGAAVAVTSRRADDAGTWVLGFKAAQAKGVHALRLSQVCESGQDGSLRTTSAATSFRIF